MDYFSKILHIDLNEDANSIIERLSFIDDQDVILAVPTGANIFQDLHGLKTLKQAIDKLGKNIVLVSQDEDGIELARDMGLRIEEEFLELLSPNETSETEHKYSAGTHQHPKVFDIVTPGVEHKTVPTPRKMPIEQTISEKEVEEFEVPIKRFEEEQMSGISEIKSGEEKIFTPKGTEKPKKMRFKITLPHIRLPGLSVMSAIVIFILTSFIIGAIAFGTILPQATIAISLKKETIDLNIPIKADVSISNIDIDQNKIPAQIIKTSKSQTMEFTASGKQTTESRASGKITIYNAFTPPQNQALVKTTRFETSDGKIFRITEGITVPAARIENGKVVPSSVEAEVVADATGPEYNVGPSEFTIPGFKGSPKFNAFYAKSVSSMAGGSKGDGLVVTTADIEKAEAEIEKVLTESVKTELQEKLLQGFEFLNEAVSVKIDEKNTSLKSGTAAEKFSITAKASATAFQFSGNDIDSLIAKNIETKTSEKEIIFKDLTKKYADINADFSSGVLLLSVNAKQSIIPNIDTENFKKDFFGKDESAIRDVIISNDSIESAQVSFWPFWVRKVPKNADRIKIIVNE